MSDALVGKSTRGLRVRVEAHSAGCRPVALEFDLPPEYGHPDVVLFTSIVRAGEEVVRDGE